MQQAYEELSTLNILEGLTFSNLEEAFKTAYLDAVMACAPDAIREYKRLRDLEACHD